MNPSHFTYFFYGTLMDNLVLNKVIGRYAKDIQKRPGVLKGFKRLGVKGANYPAIINSKGDQVEGEVVYGITDEAVLRLDEFEDDEYQRKNVVVFLRDGRKIQAATYVAGSNMLLGKDEWNFAMWQLNHRKEFMKNSVIWNRLEKISATQFE